MDLGPEDEDDDAVCEVCEMPVEDCICDEFADDEFVDDEGDDEDSPYH